MKNHSMSYPDWVKQLKSRQASRLQLRGFPVGYAQGVAKGEYCVIDLAQGREAISFPVSYCNEAPSSGWGDEYRTTKIVLKLFRPGKFLMDGKTPVEITHSFYISLFKVSNSQANLIWGENRPNGNFAEVRGRYDGGMWPVSSKVDKESFIGRLRAKTGIANLDMPTEAEFVYAASFIKPNGLCDEYDGGCGEVCLSRLGDLTARRLVDPVGSFVGYYGGTLRGAAKVGHEKERTFGVGGDFRLAITLGDGKSGASRLLGLLERAWHGDSAAMLKISEVFRNGDKQQCIPRSEAEANAWMKLAKG